MTTNRTDRPNMLRHLAERAAGHPRMESAIMGAIRGVLPSILEQLVAEQAQLQGGHVVRLYGRLAPPEQRQQRDQRARALLASGMSPDLVAVEAGCSVRHAYSIQAAMRRAAKVAP